MQGEGGLYFRMGPGKPLEQSRGSHFERQVSPMPKKRVLLIIVDALSSQYSAPAIRSGDLPNFKKLLERGVLRDESVSIFPSLTPAATSTLVTGKYPVDHGIFGFHWFDRESGEEAYYGDDFWAIGKMGFADFFHGCLQKLNSERLSCQTVFQRVENETDGASAVLNYLMFHGDKSHQAQIPLWFSWHPSVPFQEEVKGPEILYFGDLINSDERLAQDAPDRKGGLFEHFGFNDLNTARLLLHFAEQDSFPDFTVAYFPDHDWEAHSEGIENAFEKVIQVDRTLGLFFDAYGGVDKALQQFTIIVTGDHSQSDVLSSTEGAKISLTELLEGFKIAPAGKWENPQELKVCPDMRCAQIYHDATLEDDLKKLVRILLKDPRVDQVLWCDRERRTFWVETAGFGELRFSARRFREDCSSAKDLYGTTWFWVGDLGSVDGIVDDGVIRFTDYPNAFERIHGGLAHKNSGDLWVTAKPGYEFAISETTIHSNGGSHGSLHRLDSLSPLLVGGVEGDFELPEVPRAVDVTPLCLKLLGISTREMGVCAIDSLR